MASILVNGSPSSEFQFHSGLKQGDPLSPYLFILVMESLHFSFSRVVNEGIFKGISLNGKSSISHLFYADDAMFVGEWSEDNLKSIAANSIGCSIMDKCFCYLGVKVGESTSRHKAWSDLIQKLRSRLSKWKVKTLSIGGRLTLLKSVLGASSIYNMSIYKKITWAAWNKVLAAKKNGGLGVSSFHALNRALLLKWVWRYISQDGSLWYRVIQAIHGPSIESHASQVSSNWCSILRALEVLRSKGFNFLSYCSKRIGDGCQTRFWQDRWLAGMVLRDSFPRIFALELDKDVSVASKMREDMDKWCCDLSGDGEFRVKDIRNQRGVSLDSLSCPLCHASEESIHHTLIQCALAKLVFRKVCRWWDLPWQDLSSVSDWSSWFSTIRLSHKLKEMLEGVFYIAWWSIWVFCNRSIFDASPLRRPVIFDDIVSLSFIWSSSRCSKIFTTCLFGLIWNSVKIDEALGIFGVDEVEIVGDLLYGIGFCGIPCKRASAEYAGLVIELYVGGYGVKSINLF
nr:RNA-directed DNA polymerase, eukaryota [Tanacetum cinerariifolium]